MMKQRLLLGATFVFLFVLSFPCFGRHSIPIESKNPRGEAVSVSIQEIPIGGGSIHIEKKDGESNYWFSFEATTNTFIRILYCGDVLGVNLALMTDPNDEWSMEVSNNDYCIPAEYKGRGLMRQIAKGQKIYIRVKTTESIDLDVIVRTLPDHLLGGNCADPVELIQGSCYLPLHKDEKGNELPCWSTITLPYDAQLTINTGVFQSFKRYMNCGDTKPVSLYPTDGLLSVPVKANEPLYLSCSNYNPLPVDVRIQKYYDYPVLPEGGEVAIPYQSGKNEYTFQYKATENTFLRIKYCGTNRADLLYYTNPESPEPIYTGSIYCDEVSKQGRGIRIQALRGETVYLRVLFREAPAVGSNPQLNVETKKYIEIGGQDCLAPITLKYGEVYMPYNEQMPTWYTYKAPKDELLKITASDLIAFYRFADCNNPYLEYYTANDTGILWLALRHNEQLLLRSDHKRPDFIQVSSEEYVEGVNCMSPISLVLGSNNLSFARQGEHWYSYTVAKNGYLQISNCSVDASVVSLSLHKTCSSEPMASTVCPTTGKGLFLRVPVQAGEHYKVCLNNPKANPQQLTFLLEEDEPKSGEDCTNPIVAEIGANQYTEPFAKTWYHYTAQGSGRLVISADTGADFNGDLQVNTDCTGWKASAVSDATTRQIHLETFVEAGQTYLFYWKNYTGHRASFVFSLNEYPKEKGAIWDDPLVAVKGENTVPAPLDVKPGSKWYVYKSDSRGWLSATVKHTVWDPENTGRIVYYKKEGNAKPTKLVLPILIDHLNGGKDGYKHFVMVEPDAEYYLEVYTQETMPGLAFNIEESAFVTGDLCSMAIELKTPNIALKRNVGREWYSYVAPEDGYYTFVSNSLSTWASTFKSSDITVLVGDCDAEPIVSTYDKALKKFELQVQAKQGDILYIGAYNVKYQVGSVVDIRYSKTDGVDEVVSTEGVLRIYPNPAALYFFVDLGSVLPPYGLYHLTMTDLDGKIVRRELLRVEERSKVDCRHIPAGTYIVKLTDAAGSIVWIDKLTLSAR